MTGDLLNRLKASLGAQFTIERELGGGGMSRVFVATETALDRRVVVKLLTPELAAGVNVERFRREIQLAARLQHANIVPVLTTGEIDGLPYFTMPFVDGESLRTRLSRGGVGITEALSLLRDVARALAYAHANGVVHRDVKPENILLAGGAAIVADFGIAKAISAARTNPAAGNTLTQVGTSIGTPTYMAPEQAAGDIGADHRADLYAFGVVAYELLAGRPPFNHPTPQKQLAAHLTEKPVPIAERRLDVPVPLGELVMRCLEKEAADRPQRADDVVRLLDTVTSASSQPVVPAILMGGRKMLGRALGLWAVSFVLVGVIAKAATVGIGLPDWVFPGSLVVMALGLPVIFFTAFVQSQAHKLATMTPQLTPGGTAAPQGTLATMAIKASPHVSWSRTAKGGAWSVGAFVAVIGAWMLMRAFGVGPAATLLASGKLDAKERIIVSEFKSPGDTLLGATVTDAFRTDLAQSSTIAVLSSAVVRDAVRRMKRSDTTKVTEDVARQIAQRDGMKALIAGDVVSLGGGYVLSARLVSAIGNEELATFRETASDAKDIIPAIGRLSKAIRAKAGDNLRRVQAARTLDKVTTPSLEALQKYVQAVRLLETQADWDHGKPLLEEAIALDSGFAMAYRKLAIEESNRFGSPSRIQFLLQKAFDNRDRLTDEERLITEGSYYMVGPHPDRNKVIAAYERLLDRDPANVTALNNVAIMYRDLRQFAKAEETARRAVAAQPTASVFFDNVFFNQVSQGKLAAAETTLKAMAVALPKSPRVYVSRGQLAYMRGEFDSTLAYARLLQADPSRQTQRMGNGFMREVYAVRGQLATAARYRQANRDIQMAAGVKRANITMAVDAADAQLWLLNRRDRAIKTVDAALAETPLESLSMADRPYHLLAIFYARAGQVDRARQMQAAFLKRRETAPDLYDETVARDVAGQIALAEKKYDSAIREFSQATGDDCTGCRMPYLALAYDLAGHPDSAIVWHERYLDDKTFYRMNLDAEHLAPTYKRLGELYEARGDRAKAIGYYQRFVELWKGADADLQPQVQGVREKLGRLQRQGG